MKFIVIGAGEVGTSLCSKLVEEGHDVVLIDLDEARLNRAAHSLDLQTITANGMAPETLIQAGIESTDYLVSVANSDEVNIACCLMAKLISPHVRRIARIRNIQLEQIPSINGKLADYFDLVVNPDVAGAAQIQQFFKVPGAKDVFELADGKLQVLGLEIANHAPFINKTLNRIQDHWDEFPCLLLAIERDGKLIVPRGKDKLLQGDSIYAITTPEKTHQLFELAGQKPLNHDNIIIWGGSGLGKYVAQTLEGQAKSIKLLLSDEQQAIQMTDHLNSTLILHGEGTDQALLLEEGITDTDIFISASADDESNILASLLAKRLGAKMVISLVNKAEYLPLVPKIGVDIVVSSRIAAGTAIFNNIFSRSTVSEFSLRHQGAGFISIVVNSDLDLADRQLKDTVFPPGILIAAIIRNEQVIIPNGDSVINIGDQVIVFVIKSAHKRLEKLLQMKLELFN